ncbi:Zn-dependent hydrolase [Amnibacterium flavum]|uniref:Zn-dependent hydrolase n=1 Tax=Amnibacterium flavum TaxID=2173173 RepID=A0A2V1HQG1_9MICO|nr:Zn-dependent hydrolase [Amnibacterium flavum]
MDGPVQIQVIGGPTVLIEYGGLRFLTDPTFDQPQDYPGEFSKTAPPVREPGDLGMIDAVLLSHDEHVDNLDLSGRALLPSVPVALTTVSGAGRLGGNAQGLAPWQSVAFTDPTGRIVTVTATPALHGPIGADAVVGDVIGFLLSSDGLPTVYVSGDNASLDVVREISDRVGSVDTAILFAGAVRRRVLDGALLTLDGTGAALAARILDARRVVPAHVDSWAHFTEGRDEFAAAFAGAGLSHLL